METNVVIVGAGPAGLAVAACLKQAGVDFLILEKADEVAPSWRRHYRRLHLHTVKSFSSLPFVPFPKRHPRYVPREKVVAYLDSYAERFGLEPRFGVTVKSIRREGEKFLVQTDAGGISARKVVVATGNNAQPIMPDFPGIEDFKGKVLHSAAYTEAAPYAGKDVLIVGMGNTGAEIALDLAESGAHPTISVRKGVHIVPRQLFGVPIQMVGIASRTMPQALNDWMFPKILDRALGRLERYGIVRPKQGILQGIEAGRIPVIDIGTVAAIKQGRIGIAPDIASFTGDGVTFVDGVEKKFDAAIFATGYRPAYDAFLPAQLRPDKSGVNARASELGVYLVGFYNPVTGLLREIGIEAQAVARDIAGR
ncbi:MULTISPECIES: NAD(P)/FAD-dependent oxidoreductase [unclassified Mesorhizobium]|uniref:flavin-containing monooxygenase n=1 Tax=unclassified Mesorhizobium TaxID=325217 RepID=UPI000F74E8BF|nr:MULTISPECIES: NAD(P)/FAD-dependent oxidoreductase [unclassified Mesorhizobium]AZO06562.1 NAD(P)/FAD-dependent oxidoreductase [Mesorhizobium sp. M2A.F.Ca.ET.043.02.1.1]RUW40687.1 NAD(P)/FAD-dependent oxidoreductase [Mesorhizobium sp. M2A.F.Ca.ET.015.02.1.1]RUW79781.1 NAD(P)/FAD-dependent oxidoreductase [Mesorhizobium sp. M2A.F.Ca.ET.067.02.1.1]RVC91940.1 NAD(P)/FAD-dependent oxidoreductase [Mesorhizobium sp. M2A.F.Ca.ET.017.03.2.1]RVD06627.1 NAD(P)/FAD-dependent oxidoreductase [Mesorhizobium